MQEFPNIRFRAAKPGEDASSGLEARSLVAQRVAVDLNERLSLMQRNGQLPASSTCDLIIFDRCAPDGPGCSFATAILLANQRIMSIHALQGLCSVVE